MTLLPEQVKPFTLKFEEIVSQTIEPHLLIPEIVIDAVIGFKNIENGFYNIIRQMEPFGPGNMRPVFVAKNLLDSGYSKIVKEEHIRFSLKQENIILTGIGFNMANKFPLIASREPVDLVFTYRRK
jgi:single-stranded-DNA-specific exonuclease